MGATVDSRRDRHITNYRGEASVQLVFIVCNLPWAELATGIEQFNCGIICTLKQLIDVTRAVTLPKGRIPTARELGYVTKDIAAGTSSHAVFRLPCRVLQILCGRRWDRVRGCRLGRQATQVPCMAAKRAHLTPQQLNLKSESVMAHRPSLSRSSQSQYFW